ncbi:MAG: lytic transglycosylase F [gamma proteobacterium symbiont of Bathyaustriella thionipta]|nr:lytic transglycosylase F [gamma proteobacterium symbiont of Bathyaustriella thionipta]
MKNQRIFLFLSVWITALLCLLAPAALLASTEQHQNEQLESYLAPSFDDFPAIEKRRFLRILVSYNNSNYFVSGGRQQGLEYELMSLFEKFLDQKGAKKADQKLHLVFISVPFDQLIPSLLAGKGDIVAAGVTVTGARSEKVAFSQRYRSHVAEVLVKSKSAAAVKVLKDLSGKTIHVVAGSSYLSHLQALNKQFKEQGLAPINIQQADKTLASEDLLEMVNAGIYDYVVADEHIANLWHKVLPDISILSQVKISDGGNIAWAVRKDNPVLLKKLNQFVKKHRQGTLLGNMMFKRYYDNTKWVKNPLTDSRQKQLDKYAKYFKKYGRQYDFDWLFLAAIGFQESGLKQSRKSRAGAVGVMQIKPSTAADRNVGITGVAGSADKNIHAAVKYLAFLRKRYFSDPAISIGDQYDFTIAAYNAGPANIRKFRNEAKKAGLDPNRWFFNVEHIARKHVGRETVQYVANINKYYLSYQTFYKHRQEREAALKKAGG